MTQGVQSWCSVTAWRDRVGREMGGEYTREGSHVCLWTIYAAVWQRTSQHCKIIILQMGREVGGGFRMRNTCIPVADSF